MTPPYSSESVMQSVTALIVVLDEDGRIQHMNRACEQTTGFQSDDVLGQPFGETLLLDTDVLKSVKQQLKNGEIPEPSTDRESAGLRPRVFFVPQRQTLNPHP